MIEEITIRLMTDIQKFISKKIIKQVIPRFTVSREKGSKAVLLAIPKGLNMIDGVS